jgi:2-keto-4-pentenoate hydratase
MATEPAVTVPEERLSPDRNDRMRQAAEVLLAARRECRPIPSLAPELRPQSVPEAYALQDIMAQALSTPGDAVGGWKVGAPSLDATPMCAPMPMVAGFLTSGTTLAPGQSRLRGVEAELAFLLGRDLPRREEAYTHDEVVAAIASAHPAIEILESAFTDPDAVDRLSIVGDLQIHGGFAYGPAVAGWQSLDLAQETLEVFIDGALRSEKRVTEDPRPYLLRLVQWLANEGQSRTGGLRAGQWITTGSWSGKQYASPGSSVEARFAMLGTVAMKFADVE